MVKIQFDKKYYYINFLRGIAIFLMLWGHAVQYSGGSNFEFPDNMVFRFIYSFHMPLFMLISGYLFYYSSQKRSGVELIKYKTKSLLYPILTCSIVNYILSSCIVSVLRGNYNSIFSSISLNSLWFLWSVLSASIALSIAVKFTNNRFIKGLLIFAGIFIVLVFPCYKQNFRMYPYFVIGYFFSKYENRIKPVFSYLGLSSIILFLALFISKQLLFFDHISNLFNKGTFITKLFDKTFTWGVNWALGLFGSIAVAWLASIFYFRIRQLKIIKGVEYLGKYSLAVYALSVSLLSFWLPKIMNAVLNWLPWIQWDKYIWLYNFIVTPIIAVMYAVLLLLIIKLMKKINIHRLVFGR